MAGVPAEKIISIHGSEMGIVCYQCKKKYDREVIHQRILAGDSKPACDSCSGILKPTTIMFGEELDATVNMKA